MFLGHNAPLPEERLVKTLVFGIGRMAQLVQGTEMRGEAPWAVWRLVLTNSRGIVDIREKDLWGPVPSLYHLLRSGAIGSFMYAGNACFAETTDRPDATHFLVLVNQDTGGRFYCSKEEAGQIQQLIYDYCPTGE